MPKLMPKLMLLKPQSLFENLQTGSTVATGATATTVSSLTPGASSLSSLTTQCTGALQKAAINSIASSAAQSAINGDSLEDSLKNSAKNILINAAGQLVANQIGNLAHPDPTNNSSSALPDARATANPNALTNPITGEMSTTPLINLPTQLTLHAALGCAMGAAQGGNCAAGASGGVVGELVGSMLKDSIAVNDVSGSPLGSDSLRSKVMGDKITKETAVQLSGAAGAIAGLTASITTGADDSTTAKGIWAGYGEGMNAAANNALFKKRPLKNTTFLGAAPTTLANKLNIEPFHEQLFFEDEQGGNLGYFPDSKVKAEEPNLLNQYKVSESGFDDALMRQAVKNVAPKPYNLLDMKHLCSGKYNCQDWAQDVRNEYYKLQQSRR